MKTKGRRQSKNVEIRKSIKIIDSNPDSWMTVNEPFVRRDELERKVHYSEHLKNKTPIKDQKMTTMDKVINEVHNTNPQVSHKHKTREETAKPTKFRTNKDIPNNMHKK